jgi:hypothetical protein
MGGPPTTRDNAQLASSGTAADRNLWDAAAPARQTGAPGETLAFVDELDRRYLASLGHADHLIRVRRAQPASVRQISISLP